MAISSNFITDLLFLAELLTSTIGLNKHVGVRKLDAHGDCLGTRDFETNILIENSPERIFTITIHSTLPYLRECKKDRQCWDSNTTRTVSRVRTQSLITPSPFPSPTVLVRSFDLSIMLSL